MPSLYIITGSNGAGKSTVGPKYLPDEILNSCEVFDGDLLFVKKRNEYFPSITKSPKEARRIAWEFVSDKFDRLVKDALFTKSDFVYEGHFTNDATWEVPKKFKAAGFEINLIFFGLATIDLSQLRVTDRVSEGGHYVDRMTIENNFIGNLEKLNKNFRLIEHVLLLSIANQQVIYCIAQHLLPSWFKKYLPEIVKIIP
ncbi:MAG: zeta toxin family protein [Sphingobacteriales bacterium]|nr:zeta toxin family protein [Sphingobacteriales bacterium]